MSASNKMSGFTLAELLVALAIIAIITAIAVPQYQGYISTAKQTTAQDALMTIFLQQQEFLSDNNIYYFSGATCGDHGALINTNLFGGTQVLDSTNYTYCITQTTTADFTATATEVGGGNNFTIDETKTTNF